MYHHYVAMHLRIRTLEHVCTVPNVKENDEITMTKPEEIKESEPMRRHSDCLHGSLLEA